MKLNKKQKTRLLELIAEGLTAPEINQAAAEFKQPFDVSKQQVDYYRKTRFAQLAELKREYENKALQEGLARKAVRVKRLQELAEKLEEDLFDKGRIWLPMPRKVGDEIRMVGKFNRAQIDTYRNILDDLAKEVGDRERRSILDGGDDPVRVRIIEVGGIDPEVDI